MATILIIEDERDLADGLRDNLEIEGHRAEVTYTGETGLDALRSCPYDLLILDLMLPDTDGYRILRCLREEGQTLPVLMLTARGQEADKVRGFRLGADDYVTKPFGLLELLARVEALLRRSGRADTGSRFHIGEIAVDTTRRTVSRGSEEVLIAPREFDLLVALHRHDGKAVSRQDLLAEVWGHPGAVITRTVDTHIAELRRKLEPDPNRPRYILTVRKYGYRLNERR
ncbi:response regulator transcription factor [Wenzhouxiangella sp. AB-CW3]|uniref:response regulator transcription factor n=1 Tax=Wenzhouxiangella sp. AB-CW3 TaxID=2771012 RepID=UPI00168B5F1E|nr:response regulator transcription factor [Wenzhouxiangella sp. AB-CW3]QOC22388.1 response regulator transcription factor [Wenzhouxiangella sp. AB-CW3]